MATRYIGDAVVRIEYRDGGDYAGTISVPNRARFRGRGPKSLVWKFAGLSAPAVGHGPGIGYDSPQAYDSMAASAVSFGSYYTTHNRGRDTPNWAPKPEIADAIDEAVSWATDDSGDYSVRRRK